MPSSWFAEMAVGIAGSARAIGAVALVLLGLGVQFAGVRILAHIRAPIARQDLQVSGWSAPANDPARRPPELPPLRLPIGGVAVPRNPMLLPGARRDYRGGVHQGVDFDCPPGVPVRAAIGGTALWINAEPDVPPSVRSRILERCRELGRTPDDVLNALHGKRIVVCTVLPNGALLTTSYSHLGRLRRDLVPGSVIRSGEVIAWTGNSGTSHEGRADGWAELHFEVRTDGVPLGAGLSPADAGQLYRATLREGN